MCNYCRQYTTCACPYCTPVKKICPTCGGWGEIPVPAKPYYPKFIPMWPVPVFIPAFKIQDNRRWR